MNKVLIITYHWPPAGGPGIQRVLKYVKYLPQNNWEPIVLTVDAGEYLAFDHSLVDQVAQNIKVFRTPTLEPYSLYKRITNRKKDDIIPNLILTEKESKGFRDKFAKWARTNIFVPDARVGWIPYIKRIGEKIIRQEKPDIIFSSSPPHSVQVGAMRLAKKTGLPWVADFRDPWYDLDIFYGHNRRSRFSDRLDASLERKVVQRANKIITNNNYNAQLFAKENRSLDDFRIIPNGFDPEDFVNIKAEKHTDFTITHAGTLSESRIPEVLVKAIIQIREEKKIKIKMNLIGINCEPFLNLLRKYDLIKDTTISDYMPHREALSKLKSSTALLLINDRGPHDKGHIPGKIFDYLGVKRPVFGVGPPGGASDEILRNSDSGRVIHYDDTEGAVKYLGELIDDWQNHTSRFSFNSEQYEKKLLTKKLADVFNGLVK